MSWWDQQGDEAYKRQVKGELSLFAGMMPLESSLCSMIDDYLLDVQENVPRGVSRKNGWHPSELHDPCCRFEVFKRALPIANDRKRWTVEMLRRFQVGHAVHDRFQLNILGKMRTLKGRWQCSRCTREIKDTYMPDGPCPRCNWQVDVQKRKPAPSSRYSVNCASVCSWPGGYEGVRRDCAQCERGGKWLFKESWIWNEELELIGRYDGIVVMSLVEHILEMKTKDTFVWQNMSAPDERDVFQTNIYMWQTGIHQAVLCYIDKNSGLMKEFLLEFNPQIPEIALRNIDKVRKFLERGELPLGPCASSRSKRAKGCAYVRQCFMGIDNISELRNRLQEEKTND